MDIIQEIASCSKCGQLQKLFGVAIQEGHTPFIIIGESPAKDGWIVSKKAFYNTQGKLQASGRVLSKLLDIIGYKIDDIYFTECCKCIIEERKTLDKCAENCKEILFKQLLSLDSFCNIIIPMGKSPTQVLLNTKIERFSDYVGKTFDITIGERSFKVLPIYHTSPLNPKGYAENIPIFENLKQLLRNNQNHN